MEWNGKEIPFGKIGLYKKAINKEAKDKKFAELSKMKEGMQKIDCAGKQELKTQILKFVEKEVDKQLKRISADNESLMVVCHVLPINKNGEFKDASNPRFSDEAIQWRNDIFKRDNYICQECGAKGNIQAHHKEEWAINPNERYNIDNGVTLCVDCHIKKHPEKEALLRKSRAKNRTL